jgi:A/G-specific adenine glycosylase
LAFKKAWHKKILNWYKVNKRNLPWRRKTYQNFYRIWISEVMLQQTVVNTVIPYYKNFLEKWPNLRSFYSATLEEILIVWQGLGYYQRARNLFKAKEYLKNHKLEIDSKSLINLPGIGNYSSCSIAAILKDEACTVVDGNIERILSRVFGLNRSEKKFKKKIFNIAETLTPKKNNRFYFQSLMDLANIICKSKTPECEICPIHEFCESKNRTKFEIKKTYKKKNKIGISFLIKYKNSFLVGVSKKRILQGLYQLPETEYQEIERGKNVKNIFNQMILSWKKKKNILEKFRVVDFVEHNFSHFHLNLMLVEIVLYKKIEIDEFSWLTLNEYRKKPMSSLMRKVVQLIK